MKKNLSAPHLRYPVRVAAASFIAAIIVVTYTVFYDDLQQLVPATIQTLGALIMVTLAAMFAIVRSDIKYRRLAEELKRVKERQDSLMREKMTVEGITEGSPVPTFVIDKQHKIILWNRACTELTGFSAEEMIGTDHLYKPFYDEERPFLADLIVDQNIQDFETFYGKGEVNESEIIKGAYKCIKHFQNLGGKDRHLHFLAAPIYDENGEIVAAIETFLDVTTETELTRSLQENAERLQNNVNENIKLRKEVEELYNYLESIIESLPEKIFDIDKDGIINYVSRELDRERTLPSNLKGKHFTQFVSPEHREYVMERWEEAMKGNFDPYELEQMRSGKKRTLIITSSPVKGTQRHLLVQRDITDFKELEKKYYESQKLAAIGQLSAGIAHEVRNPLSSIKMSLQILEKRMQPQGNDLKRFKIAQREVEHLEQLVKDVLIYAKPSRPQKERCDMRLVIDNALSLVEKSLQDKQIIIQRNFADDLPDLMVDASMLSQALINVFQNAIDAMELGGALILSMTHSAGIFTIEIEDNGSGINEEDLPYIFNPFYTRKSYGTGLGLTQVEKIIDQHEGDIKILSKKGEGTHFIITLPCS